MNTDKTACIQLHVIIWFTNVEPHARALKVQQNPYPSTQHCITTVVALPYHLQNYHQSLDYVHLANSRVSSHWLKHGWVTGWSSAVKHVNSVAAFGWRLHILSIFWKHICLTETAMLRGCFWLPHINVNTYSLTLSTNTKYISCWLYWVHNTSTQNTETSPQRLSCLSCLDVFM